MWSWAAGSIKKLSWVQMAEMRFLCRVAWLAVCIRVRSLIIWEHCRIERRQLKWFGHHVRMPLGQLFGRAVLDNSNWTETQWARIRTCLRYYISQFAWENSGNPLRRMWYQWPWEWEVWTELLILLKPWPHQEKWKENDNEYLGANFYLSDLLNTI